MLELKYTLEGQTYTVPLFDGHYVLGRGKGSDVVIKDPSVSGQHLRIEVRDGQVTFRDLHSSNGSYLNKVKCDSGTLCLGDTLKLGKVKMRVVSDALGADPIGGGAPDDGAEVTPDAEFEDFHAPVAAPPPLPGGSGSGSMVPVPAGMSPGAGGESRAVAVIGPKTQEAQGGMDAAQKKRLLLLGGAVAAVLLVLVLALALRPKPAPPTTEDTGLMTFADYWDGIRRGVSQYDQGNVREALSTWRSVETKFNADNPRNQLIVGQVFSEPIRLRALLEHEDVPDINWSQLRMGILSLQEQNLLSDPTLDRFARTLEQRCRLEHNAKQIYEAAEQAFRSRKWEETREQALQIPVDSVYHRFVDPLLARVTSAVLNEIREDAVTQGRAQNFRRAIQLANRFRAEGGEDPVLEESVHRWQQELDIADAVEGFLQRQSHAESPSEIEAVLRLGMELEERHQTHRLVMEQVRPRIRELNQRIYIAKLQDVYDAGDEEALRELRGEIFAEEMTAARSLFQKHQQVKDMLARAEEAESGGRFEDALVLWQQVMEHEPNERNYYHQQASMKRRAYSPERLAQMYIQAAQNAVQREEYFLARQLLQRAEANGGDIIRLVEGIQQIGRRKFTEALNAHNARIWVTRHMEVNLALDCFMPGEDFHTRIMTRMEQWGETRRQPKTIDD